MNNIEINNYIFLGMVIGAIFQLIDSLSNYLMEKSWKAKDYERIIYNYLNTYDTADYNEKKIIADVHAKFERNFKREKALKEFFLKFKKGNKK